MFFKERGSLPSLKLGKKTDDLTTLYSNLNLRYRIVEEILKINENVSKSYFFRINNCNQFGITEKYFFKPNVEGMATDYSGNWDGKFTYATFAAL